MPDEPTNLVTSRPTGLVEVLDRILDKGLVIVGDIKISLVSVELLTIRLRLILCSIDKAEQIGLDWWRYDPGMLARGDGGGEAALPGREAPDGREPERQGPPLASPAAEEQPEPAAPGREESGTGRRKGGRARS